MAARRCISNAIQRNGLIRRSLVAAPKSVAESTRTCRTLASAVCNKFRNDQSRQVTSNAALVFASVAGIGTAVTFAECQESKHSSSTGTALCQAAASGNLNLVKNILDRGQDPNEKHKSGWTALHVASINGRLDIVNALLDAGADVNIIDNYSPQEGLKSQREYYERIKSRETDFSKIVDPSYPTKGFTALHYAVLSSSTNIIDKLGEHHVNPSLEDEHGYSAAHYTNSSIVQDKLDKLKQAYNKWSEEEAVRQADLDRKKRREFPLEKRVKKVVVGQHGPINSVAAAIRRRENGWHDDEHPLVFLFLGSSGLGKTELAKQMASYLHSDDRKGFVRIDMTEYQSKHEAAKFIGSPPGYIGYDEGGQLTKLLEETPNAVVLLDEVEKAHPDVLNLMLQLFDEGRITDGQGKTIECKDAVFVMTSNLASDEIASHGVDLRNEAAMLGTSDESIAMSKAFKENVIRPILKAHFKRDEFLGRIDEMLYFLPFSEAELKQLITLQLERWSQKAATRHNINLSWDPEVLSLLVDEYDIHYGARSLQHAVDQLVINKIAQAHEMGRIHPRGSVRICVEKDEINLKATAPSKKDGESWSSYLSLSK